MRLVNKYTPQYRGFLKILYVLLQNTPSNRDCLVSIKDEVLQSENDGVVGYQVI